jgi:AcrR family transcriptional regulator
VEHGAGHGRVMTTAADPGRRELHKQATRRAIEDVALALFAERGFDGVTVDEIVAAADVSKRTFYRYYEAKEDVLLAEHRRLLPLVHDALLARPAEERLLDALAEALLEAGRQLGPDAGRLLDKTRLLFETPSLAARIAQHQLAWERAFADTIAARQGLTADQRPRAELLAAALLAALRVMTRRWLRRGAPEGFAADLTAQFRELRAGLAEI